MNIDAQRHDRGDRKEFCEDAASRLKPDNAANQLAASECAHH